MWSAIDFLAGTSSKSEGDNGESSPWAELEQKVQMLSDSLHDLQTIRSQVAAVDEVTKQFESRFCFIQLILVTVKEMSNTLQGLLDRVGQKENKTFHNPIFTPADPWTSSLNQGSVNTMLPNVFPPAQPPDTDVRIRSLEHSIKSLKKHIVGDGIRIKSFSFQSQEDL
jgi:hypothetical protein